MVKDYTETSLSGIYIYAEIYKSQEYNFQINNFEVITRKKYVVTEFHIDMKITIWTFGEQPKMYKNYYIHIISF